MRNSISLFTLLCLLLTGWGCSSSSDSEPPLDTVIENSLDRAIEQYKQLDQALPDSVMPRTSEDDSLITNAHWWWTSGFFPGSLWYLYEYSQDTTVKNIAERRTWAIEDQKFNSNDHDIGFKIYCSFGNAYRLTQDTSYANVVMTAAETLTTRFDSDVGAIRSWGDRDNQEDPYLVIVDNMMNLELLFWATEYSGDSTYADIAIEHANTTLENHYRDDGSSYHVVEYDPQTGEVLEKRTQQGHADSSAWSRGQAWGLYGYTMSYRETGIEEYLQQAETIADFLLNHPNLPENLIPYWDFDAPGIPNTPRDASAAAITASSLLELSQYVSDAKGQTYQEAAQTIIRSLSGSEYRTEVGESSNFLLKHSVGSYPQNSEVNVPLSYADYYYIESMMRYRDLEQGEQIPE